MKKRGELGDLDISPPVNEVASGGDKEEPEEKDEQAEEQEIVEEEKEEQDGKEEQGEAVADE
jgi:hypothetical protein